jgi:hypothetical protein
LFLRTDREKRQAKTLKQAVATIGQAKAKRKVFPLPSPFLIADDSNQPQKAPKDSPDPS